MSPLARKRASDPGGYVDDLGRTRSAGVCGPSGGPLSRGALASIRSTKLFPLASSLTCELPLGLRRLHLTKLRLGL